MRGQLSATSQRLFEKKSSLRSTSLVELEKLLSSAAREDLEGQTVTLTEGLLRCAGKGATGKEREPACLALMHILLRSPEVSEEVLHAMKKGLDGVFCSSSCVTKPALASLYGVTALALHATTAHIDHEAVIGTLLNTLLSTLQDISKSSRDVEKAVSSPILAPKARAKEHTKKKKPASFHLRNAKGKKPIAHAGSSASKADMTDAATDSDAAGDLAVDEDENDELENDSTLETQQDEANEENIHQSESQTFQARPVSSHSSIVLSPRVDSECSTLLSVFGGTLCALGLPRVVGYVHGILVPHLVPLALHGSGESQRAAVALLNTLYSAAIEAGGIGNESVSRDFNPLPHVSAPVRLPYGSESHVANSVIAKSLEECPFSAEYANRLIKDLEALRQRHIAGAKKSDKSSLNKDLAGLVDTIEAALEVGEKDAGETFTVTEEEVQTSLGTQTIEGSLPVAACHFLKTALGPHWQNSLASSEFLNAILGTQGSGDTASGRGGSGVSRATKIAFARAAEKSRETQLKKMRDMKHASREM